MVQIEMNRIRRRMSNLASAIVPVLLGRQGTRLWYVAFGLFLVAFIVAFEYESLKKPKLTGDGWEYWYQAESFYRHGSPELREEDLETINNEVIRLGIGTPYPTPYAYSTAPDGRQYGVHFWAYGLSAAVTEKYQILRGRTLLADLPLANLCWYAIALGITLFGSNAPIRERIAMASFTAIGPIFWYIEWTGAEVFSWSFTVISVVAYRDRRYGLAGFSAGFAALQNPTIVFIGAVAVLQAARERRFRDAIIASAGVSCGLLPYAFFLYHFGKPNLIASEFATINNISWVRTWSLIGDFNQGLLPYVPVIVIGLIFGLIRLVILGNTRGLLLAAGGIAMAVGTQVAHNWNSACDGLQRYLVWMLPVAAGVAIEGIGGKWRMWTFAILAAVSNFAIFDINNETNSLKGGCLSHTPLTEWILTNHPRAYWAEPEVFIERQRHEDNWPLTPSDFPIAYIRSDGTVSKMLLDPSSLEKVAARFDVDPQFMDSLRERATHESGLFYCHPENGAVRVRHLP
jgi:hypothetical protein